MSDFKNQRSDNDKTSIIAKTDNRPGSLVDFLKNFQDHGINLTKIESRPLREEQFKSMFFIDFKGHIDDQNIQDVIAKSPAEIKWLGSYIAGEEDAL